MTLVDKNTRFSRYLCELSFLFRDSFLFQSRGFFNFAYNEGNELGYWPKQLQNDPEDRETTHNARRRVAIRLDKRGKNRFKIK
ncbi:hypothetical protein TNCT_103991 [Trichonephila clavata]|uniref:Uncharacterized protein n=1 Tax=Trichonephila clavata TaxID=2740835 RepID=A0A8X6KSE6_TRICU|nr:hypothetical protein TNCT_103991 [Trichonephila clavata]